MAFFWISENHVLWPKFWLTEKRHLWESKWCNCVIKVDICKKNYFRNSCVGVRPSSFIICDGRYKTIPKKVVWIKLRKMAVPHPGRPYRRCPMRNFWNRYGLSLAWPSFIYMVQYQGHHIVVCTSWRFEFCVWLCVFACVCQENRCEWRDEDIVEMERWQVID